MGLVTGGGCKRPGLLFCINRYVAWMSELYWCAESTHSVTQCYKAGWIHLLLLEVMYLLSTLHRTAVPCRDTTTDLRHVCTSSSSVCHNADYGRPFDPSFYTWRPSVSCGCRTRLELSAVLAASSPVTDDIQTPLKSRTVDSSFTWLSYCTINMCVFSLILYSALAMDIAVSRHYNHSLV